MHEQCPNCGIEYEREHGYFMMSIFIGYILGFLIMVPILVVLFLMKVPIAVYFIVSTIVLIPVSPLIFRYSRVLWLHLDEMMDPRPVTPQE